MAGLRGAGNYLPNAAKTPTAEVPLRRCDRGPSASPAGTSGLWPAFTLLVKRVSEACDEAFDGVFGCGNAEDFTLTRRVGYIAARLEPLEHGGHVRGNGDAVARGPCRT